MPPSTSSHEDQFDFLISCIKHSVNGKIEWDEVAKDRNIISKAAAAKRYERLMKAHGISNTSGNVATAQSSPKAAKASTPKKTTGAKRTNGAKKRKRDIDDEKAREEGDDDEGGVVKPEPELGSEEASVKSLLQGDDEGLDVEVEHVEMSTDDVKEDDHEGTG
ncbi:MAG: hypothetical protein M1833_003331 [Piccolia ochrophora]|nr:MAG: hypothetical protein M1833_003331 [Piccolia ochrophora]